MSCGVVTTMGSRRHIDHEVVKIVPSRLIQKLSEGLSNERAAPDHGLIGRNHEADGVDLKSLGLNRIHVDAVGTCRLPFGAEHCGLRRSVNICVEHAHASPFGSKSQRKIGSNGGLAHPALAGAHGNDVFDIGQSFKRALHAVRNDVARNGNERRLGSSLEKSLLDAAFNFGGNRLYGIARYDGKRNAIAVDDDVFNGLVVAKGLVPNRLFYGTGYGDDLIVGQHGVSFVC